MAFRKDEQARKEAETEKGEVQSTITSFEMQGQEAQWVEGEGEAETQTVISKKPRASIFKSFRKLREKKVTINQSRVVLLAPTVHDESEERRSEAARKAHYARRLLDAALRPDDQPGDKEFHGKDKDDMIRVAFKYAADARRLVDDDADLEQSLLRRKSKGEAAAWEARRLLSTSSSSVYTDPSEFSDDDNETSVGGHAPLRLLDQVNLYTPQDMLDAAADYSKRARSHLEYILYTFERTTTANLYADDTLVEGIRDEQTAPPQIGRGGVAHEDLTLSTLGFDNTFQDESLTSPRNHLSKPFSVSSLNEILDGTDADDTPSATPQASDERKLQTVQPEAKTKGRFNLFKRNKLDEQIVPESAKGKVEPGSTGGIITNNAIAGKQKEKELSATKGTNDPVMVATVVNGVEETSEAHLTSQVESAKEIKERTESRLKEALANDHVGAITSIDGVIRAKPAFSEGSPSLDLLQKTAPYERQPTFIPAPKFDSQIMSSQSWDKLLDGKSLKDILSTRDKPVEPVNVPEPIVEHPKTVQDERPEKKNKWGFRKHQKPISQKEMPKHKGPMVPTQVKPGAPERNPPLDSDHLQTTEPSQLQSTVALAPQIDNQIMSPQTWDDLLDAEKPKEPVPRAVPRLPAKKKKMGFLKFVKHGKQRVSQKQLSKEEAFSTNTGVLTVSTDATNKSLEISFLNGDELLSGQLSEDKEPLPETDGIESLLEDSSEDGDKSLSTIADLNDSDDSLFSHDDGGCGSSSTESTIEELARTNSLVLPTMTTDSMDPHGDRYTTLVDDTDSVHAHAKKRLATKAPIVTDIDMMPEKADLRTIRLVTSMQIDDEAEPMEALEFAEIEIGADDPEYTERAILNRDAVVKTFNTPRAVVSPPFERVSTVNNGNIPGDIQATESFMEMIDKERMQQEEEKKRQKAEKELERRRQEEEELERRRLEEEDKVASLKTPEKPSKSFIGILGRRRGKREKVATPKKKSELPVARA